MQKICNPYFKEDYPLKYLSRKFDKPAMKWESGSCFWGLNGECHRVGKPARIYSSGYFDYYENGEEVK